LLACWDDAATADPRYLTAFSSTRSEAIVPVVAPATGAVVGTLDVESAERDAFTDADQPDLLPPAYRRTL
jgi:putative methionine-R-sulfoxide reductase with GAF domain